MSDAVGAARPLLVAAIMLAGLAACDMVRTIVGSEEEEILPGERISVLQLQQSLEPDPGIADLAVRLPPPYVNDEWPQAGGYPGHAMHHLEAGEVLGRAWQVRVGSGSDSDARLLAAPIVAGGRVYVLDSRGRIAALDAQSGDRLWRYRLTPEGEDDESALGGGIAYEGGVLYVANGFGEVLALDAGSGALYWRRTIGVPVRAPPTVAGGRVFAVSYDNRLHALAAANGEVLWTHSGIVEDAGLLGGASPAVEGSIVVAPYSSGELFALRVENGRVAWSDSLSRTALLTPLASLSDINGRPVVDRGRVYAVSHAGRLAAIDLQTGARVWERNIASVEAPWVAGDFIYLVTTESEVVCLSRRDGRIRWVRVLQRYEDEEDKDDPIHWSGPVLAGDRLIVTSSHGEALSLSPYTGELTGRLELSDDVFIAPVVAGATIYILSDDGELTAYR